MEPTIRGSVAWGHCDVPCNLAVCPTERAVAFPCALAYRFCAGPVVNGAAQLARASCRLNTRGAEKLDAHAIINNI